MPLGKARFLKETGIRETDWSGKYWTRWSSAISEAGFVPQTFQLANDRKTALSKLVSLARRLERWPTIAEMKLAKREDPFFPAEKSLLRRGKGSRAALLDELLEFCNTDEDHEDVRRIISAIRETSASPLIALTEDRDSVIGTVYLIHAGSHYKIGVTTALYRRASQIANGNPHGAELIHSFETDDPRGIEAYWHNRFADKRVKGKNIESGEWFSLAKSDIACVLQAKEVHVAIYQIQSILIDSSTRRSYDLAMAVQLTPALEEELQHLAAQSNSTTDELAQHALEDFVAYRRDLNEAVARGDADIAAGRVLDHEEVFARIDRLLQSK